MKEAPKDETQ